MSREKVTATFTSKGDTTDWISSTYENYDENLDISFTVSSDWDGMVKLEKTKDGGDTIFEINWFCSSVDFSIEDTSKGVKYRLRCQHCETGSAEGGIYK